MSEQQPMENIGKSGDHLGVVTRSKIKIKSLCSMGSSILVPLVLGVFTIIMAHNQQYQADQQWKIENQRRGQEMQITIEKYQNDLLVAYIKEIGDMLKDNEYSLIEKPAVATLARAKTLTTLSQLDATRAAHILRFLYESKLLTPNASTPSLDLSTASFNNISKHILKTSKTVGKLVLKSTIFEQCNFTDLIVESIDLSSVLMKNVIFSSSTLTYWASNTANAIATCMIDINFESARLYSVYFNYATLSKTVFTEAELNQVRFVDGILSHTLFINAKLINVDFSYANLVSVDFSGVSQLDMVNFSHAVLYHVQFNRAHMKHVNFESAILYNVTFNGVVSEEIQFSSAVLVEVDFTGAQLIAANFTRARRMKVIFSDTELREAMFLSANMKNVEFQGELKIESADFNGSNLQKTNFRQTSQFLSEMKFAGALSIHDAVDTDGLPMRDPNLVNYENFSCNSSSLMNWTTHIGKVNMLSFQGFDWTHCRFTLDANYNNASLSKSISLSKIWNWDLWPSTYAILNAKMTTGVRIELLGIDINDKVLIHKNMIPESSSSTHLRMRLNRDMQYLRIQIHFESNSTHHTDEIWCSGVELFLDYGTEVENRAVVPILPLSARWNPQGMTVLKGLSWPHGLTVDEDDGTVYVADSEHHRIVAMKPGTNDINGRVVAGGSGYGIGLKQFNGPVDVLIDKETKSLIISDRGNGRIMRWSLRKGTEQGEIMIENITNCFGLAMDDEGALYVSSLSTHDVRRFIRGDKIGTPVAGGNGEGNGLDQLNSPCYIAVSHEGDVYISDWNNHRVMKWSKGARQGVVVAGHGGQGKDLTQLLYPRGVSVDTHGTVYVVETADNQRVTRWKKGATKGELIVGGNGQGSRVNQFNVPEGLSFDSHGNLFVADCWNHRVQRFSIA